MGKTMMVELVAVGMSGLMFGIIVGLAATTRTSFSIGVAVVLGCWFLISLVMFAKASS